MLHPLAIVLTAVCDLEQDYNARFLEEAEPSENDPRLVAYVLLCDLFNENEIRSRIPPGSQFFKRVRQNQDARYHCLLEAEIRGRSRGLADRFLDFKAAFALPTAALYQGDTRVLDFARRRVAADLHPRLHASLLRVSIARWSPVNLETRLGGAAHSADPRGSSGPGTCRRAHAAPDSERQGRLRGSYLPGSSA